MRLSLRTRFFAAIGLVLGVIVGAFGFGLYQFVEVLEEELLNHTLARELEEFADRYAHEPELAPPDGAELTGYIQRPGAPGLLPEALRALPPGMHEEVYLDDGREVMVGRKDVEGARLYLVLDAARVEDLEDQLIGLALLCAVAALLLGAVGAVVLARIVMRPVTRLSEAVASIDPRQRGVRLVQQFGDREVGLIAAAMDRYLEQLDSLIEREQAFTEDASHELRTPLATILSATELQLEDTGLTPQARERLARVQRAGQQMQALIEALLMLARDDAASPPQPVALDELVQEAVDSLRDTAARRGVSFTLEAEPVTRPAPPGMASVVVNNLLLNAIQHGGGGPVAVEVGPAGLSVADRGGGIAPDDLSRIFERRYRGADSRGLGLGLYLVKRMCDRLGWSVRAASSGAGTRFEVRFGPAPTEN